MQKEKEIKNKYFKSRNPETQIKNFNKKYNRSKEKEKLRNLLKIELGK